MANPIYRFFLRIDSGSQQAVHPVWKDDLALDYKLESNEMFYRAELSSSIDFIREDYDLIMAADFDREFYLDIERSVDEGANWSAYYTGYFTKTDCTFNVDDMRVTVKPETIDRYTAILNGMEKEYDLIKLAPAIVPVYLTRRPMLQVYVPGENIITCILGNQSWTQEVTEECSQEGKLRDDYHFGSQDSGAELTCNTTVTGMTATFTGTLNFPNQEGEWQAMTNSQGQYKIFYYQEAQVAQDYVILKNGLRVRRNSDNEVCWSLDMNVIYAIDNPNIKWLDIPNEFTFTGQNSMSGTDFDASYILTGVFARWIMAGNIFGNIDCYDIPDGDLVANNRNYRWCYPYNAATTMLVYSTAESLVPTEWGIKDVSAGKYYVKPDPSDYSGVTDFFPIARNNWQNASIWLKSTQDIIDWEVTFRWESYLKDSFVLNDVIDALLQKVAPDVKFRGVAEYSEFLYGTNPYVYAMNWGRIFMTPKSNLMKIEYSQPARKAPITLKEVLDMLRDTMNLYWYINDDDHLVIEHIEWFRNGGTYSGTKNVGIDLTDMVNKRNGKTYDFGQNKYTYDKVDMPERFQYGWMDDTTTFFKGLPIDVMSKFVDKGNVEEVNVAKFNADIDYIMLNPSNVSEDGFGLLMCLPYYASYKTSIAQVDGSMMQNWQMSFDWTQQNFLKYDMPAWRILVNNQVITAGSIQMKKKQQVTVPLGDDDPDLNELVHTGLGDGMIEKCSISLTSRVAKMTLMFETTERPI